MLGCGNHAPEELRNVHRMVEPVDVAANDPPLSLVAYRAASTAEFKYVSHHESEQVDRVRATRWKKTSRLGPKPLESINSRQFHFITIDGEIHRSRRSVVDG